MIHSWITHRSVSLSTEPATDVKRIFKKAGGNGIYQMSALEFSNNEQFFTDSCLGDLSPYVALRILTGVISP